jgi:restriction endonuclease S subunit
MIFHASCFSGLPLSGPPSTCLADYLVYLLKGNAFYHHCIPEMTGVSVPTISPGQINDFLVAIPPIDEQATFSIMQTSSRRR